MMESVLQKARNFVSCFSGFGVQVHTFASFVPANDVPGISSFDGLASMLLNIYDAKVAGAFRLRLLFADCVCVCVIVVEVFKVAESLESRPFREYSRLPSSGRSIFCVRTCVREGEEKFVINFCRRWDLWHNWEDFD